MAPDSLAAIESTARAGYGKDLFEGNLQALAAQLLASDAALHREFNGNAPALAAYLKQLGRETRDIPPAPLGPAPRPAPTPPAARAAVPAARAHTQHQADAPAPLHAQGPTFAARMPLNELLSRAGVRRFDAIGGNAAAATSLLNFERVFRALNLDPVVLAPFDLTVDRAASMAMLERFSSQPAELHHMLAV